MIIIILIVFVVYYSQQLYMLLCLCCMLLCCIEIVAKCHWTTFFLMLGDDQVLVNLCVTMPNAARYVRAHKQQQQQQASYAGLRKSPEAMRHSATLYLDTKTVAVGLGYSCLESR